MKSDFLLAITQLAAEKNLSKEVILWTVQQALVSAFKKDNFAAGQNFSVKVNPQSGEVKVYVQKGVVVKVTDPHRELSLVEAQGLKKDVRAGDVVDVESTPQNAGRIAAQIARQVILQRLREAERDAIYAEYAQKEGDIVSGIVQRVEPKQVVVDLGRAEAILPQAEQVSTEHYRPRQQIKVYLTEAPGSARKGPLIVSRAHRGMLRRLFELEIPEIRSGLVELKAIAREPGSRSKVAVIARQEGIDPIGCCVGSRGNRIQKIIQELNGEKIDVVRWDPDEAVFIANALSPAPVVDVEINDADKTATVVVPDRQLSLAIGKEGQNARLAAKLTGWRIDIKSVSMAEAEKVARKEAARQEALAQPQEVMEPVVEAAISVAETKEAPTPSLEEEPGAEAPAEVAPSPALEPLLPLEEFLLEPEAVGAPASLRFAEDLALPKTAKVEDKGAKERKKGSPKEDKEEREGGIKAKKARRQRLTIGDEEEYEGL